MVLEERVCLNSTLDVLKDWNSALSGHLGPFASEIIDRISAEELNSRPGSSPSDGGPKP